MDQELIYKNRKKIIIIATCIIMAILAISAAFIVENILNSATLNIMVAPTNAKVLINGREYSSEGEYKIRPGEYTAEISADGFIARTENFTVEDGGMEKLWLFLDPEDGNPNWFYDNPRDGLIVGAIREVYTLDAISQLQEANPILNDLPVDVDFYTGDYSKKISYTISYEMSADKTSFEIVIEDRTGGNYEAALSKIRNLGYEPSDYKITYKDTSDQYRNYRAE